MPSNLAPIGAINPGPGRLPAGTVTASALVTPPGGGGSDAALQAHITKIDGAHKGSAISYANTSTHWIGQPDYPASDVQEQLDNIVLDLSSVVTNESGSEKIGSASINSAHNIVNLTSGAIYHHLSSLVNSGNIEHHGTGTWQDGSSLSDATVESQLNGIVDTLGSLNGSQKVGSSTITTDMIVLASGSMYAQLNGLVNTLVGPGASEGASTIGFYTNGSTHFSSISPKTVATAFGKIDADGAFKDTANTWAASQTFSASTTFNNVATFNDLASFGWDVVIVGNHALGLGDDAYLRCTGTIGLNNNPAPATPVKNKLIAGLMPKAWAVISLDGTSGGGQTIDDGVNIDSAQYIDLPGGSTDCGLKITLPVGGEMGNTDYAAVGSLVVHDLAFGPITVCLQHNPDIGWTALNRTTSAFVLRAIGSPNVDVAWPSLNGSKLIVFVYGKQS